VTLRLVATDLDGTLVRDDGTVSARTVAAVTAVVALGVSVVFATGRPPRWMAEIVEATGHTDTAICSNGAIVYELGTGEVVESSLMSPSTGAVVVERLRQVLPGATFAAESLDGYSREPQYQPVWDVGVRSRLAPAEDLVGVPLAKLLVRDSGMLSDVMARLATETLGDLVQVTLSTPGYGLIEISAPGVTKGSGLSRLCETRGIEAHEVVAFGDMPNDVPMFGWAGTSYVMAGGHPEAVTASTHQALGCHDDGVAQVLESLFSL
jgi:Cof subfamily protein (haloacid dehalogenase superfamily)